MVEQDELQRLRELLAAAESIKLEAQAALDEAKKTETVGEIKKMELGEESADVEELKRMTKEAAKKLEAVRCENEDLKKRAAGAAVEALATDEENTAMMRRMEDEIAESEARQERLRGEIKTSVGATEKLAAELCRIRVQAEQWRKAAEAAAEALSLPHDDGSPLVAGDDRAAARRRGAGLLVIGDLLLRKRAQQQSSD